jgi:hypothetical protein
MTSNKQTYSPIPLLMLIACAFVASLFIGYIAFDVVVLKVIELMR